MYAFCCGLPGWMYSKQMLRFSAHIYSYDNALAKTIDELIKAEVIHRRGPWRSFEAEEYATLEWVDWFSNRRLLDPSEISHQQSPIIFYAALERLDMAA